MIENLKRFFSYQSYMSMNTNLENVSVFYKTAESDAQVIVLHDMKAGIELTKEQYSHILHQIEQAFLKKEYGTVSILSLLATKNIDRVKAFCDSEEFVHWIIDMNSNRLVIYENQPSDFYQVRPLLESILIGKLHAIDTEYRAEANPIRKDRSLGQRVKTGEVKGRFQGYTYNKPFWTISLIIINALIFLAVSATATEGNITSQHLLDWGGNEYTRVVDGLQVYRLFTAMFLHADFDHLVNNMFILLMIGERLERILGAKKYMIVYVCSGLMASIGSLIYYHMIGINVVGVGASGAIFGIVGGIGYLVIRYGGRGLDITPNRLILFVVISLYGGFRSAGQVDNAAHVVGFLSGIVITMLLDNYQNRKRAR